MQRRKLALAALLLVGVGLAGTLAVQWLSAPRHRITPQAAAEVRAGMTEAEVEAVFGVPAGDYSGGTAEAAPGSTLMIGPGWREWLDETGCVQVDFEDGRVRSVIVRDVSVVRESLLDRVRRWIGL